MADSRLRVSGRRERRRGMATALLHVNFLNSHPGVPVRRGLVAGMLLMLVTQTVLAQPVDTTKISRQPLFVKQDAFIAAGFVLGAFVAAPVDKHIANQLRRDSASLNKVVDESAEFFEWMGDPGPYLIGPGMYAVGRLIDNKEMADLGLHGTEAVLLGSMIVAVGKGLAGRARPYRDPDNPRNFKLNRGWKQGDYRSFPSGHSLGGFAAAAAVTAETSRWWPRSKWIIGPLMYGGAAMIATSRMYHNKHWASDVVMGAGIGTFAGLKVVRYHHSHPGNRIDRWLLSASVAPNPDGGAVVGWTVPIE